MNFTPNIFYFQEKTGRIPAQVPDSMPCRNSGDALLIMGEKGLRTEKNGEFRGHITKFSPLLTQFLSHPPAFSLAD